MKYKSYVEQFKDKCESFNEETLYEYFDNVCKYLIVCDYDYSVSNAIERVIQSKRLIKDYYDRKEPVSDCALDIGYSCG